MANGGNLGKQVADYYTKLAYDPLLDLSDGVYVPKKWELPPMSLRNVITQQYIAEMTYCLEFAKASRNLMVETIKDILVKRTGCTFSDANLDVHHNYARLETHFGDTYWIHRKGATSADNGELGLIPGSQGSASYVVEGYGNPESFKSCSHGAGRRMGRQEAKRTLDLADEAAKLDALGVLHDMRNKSDLDEAAGAYKDIETVMFDQSDLVKIRHKLTPLIVLKG